MAATGSRICVKNLPKNVEESRLKQVFSQKGEVTDAKLMRSKDGKSRQFAFIGFQTASEANEALKYFDNTYLGTCRITCEIARKIGDSNMPRPWSRYSLKKEVQTPDEVINGNVSGHENAEGAKKKFMKDSKNDDPKLQEFLQVMQPRSKTKLWANDTLAGPPASQPPSQPNSEDSGEQSVPMFDMREVDEDENSLKDANTGGKLKSLAHDTAISDMDYFKSKVKKKWLDSESSDEENGDEESLKNQEEVKCALKVEPEHQQGISTDNGRDGAMRDKNLIEESYDDVIGSENLSCHEDKEEQLETGRLFLRNLPYSATEDDLEVIFGKYGDITEIRVLVDKETKRSKGMAFVLYALPEAAARALEELDNSSFQGRLLHVMPAKQKTSSSKQDDIVGRVTNSSKTFKQQRQEKRKASEASGDTKAWNSLFVQADTVVENVARRHGISKSDVLDPDADDHAVRLALGETQVIQETKKGLENAGVNVASIEKFAAGGTDCMKRSNHVLLVKNLPYGSCESELAKMFGKFGNIDKIILPSTKALALVVFLESSEARAAFRGLAYKKYKDAPLYLEWAPVDVLSPTPASNNEKMDGVVGDHDAKRHLFEQAVEEISDFNLDPDMDPDRVESRSLFVKNLNFKTSDDSLRQHFSQHMKEGKITSLRINKHMKNQKLVSMGFGFIEFDSVETAAKVCKGVQGTVLDGHALILQLCHAKKDAQVLKKVEKDRSSTKLIVRNVAFEATELDLKQLFGPFGKIKKLRLPKKLGRHRGFAFVEYYTKQEARNAIQALSSTHLYGRHLVLEMAKEGETLDELRARTAAQFTGFEGKLTKKRTPMAILDGDNTKFARIAE